MFPTHISILFCVAQLPHSNLGRSLLRFLNHTQIHTHTQTVGLPSTNDQLVAVATTNMTHDKLKTPTFIPSADFAIPAIKRLLTHALEHMANEVYTLQIAATCVGKMSWCESRKWLIKAILFPMVLWIVRISSAQSYLRWSFQANLRSLPDAPDKSINVKWSWINPSAFYFVTLLKKIYLHLLLQRWRT